VSDAGTRISNLPIPANEDDWNRLYRALRPIVYSELFRVLPRPYFGAEDIWHDLFVRIMEEPQLLGEVSPGARETYIRVAARRRALDYLRKARTSAAGSIDEIAEPMAPVSDPSMKLDAEKAIKVAGERDGELLRMRFVEDLALGEVARRAGESYANAAVRIFRALAKLRTQLSKSAG